MWRAAPRLSANTVAQNPAGSVIPPLSASHVLGGGGFGVRAIEGAAGLGTESAVGEQAPSQARPRSAVVPRSAYAVRSRPDMGTSEMPGSDHIYAVWRRVQGEGRGSSFPAITAALCHSERAKRDEESRSSRFGG